MVPETVVVKVTILSVFSCFTCSSECIGHFGLEQGKNDELTLTQRATDNPVFTMFL